MAFGPITSWEIDEETVEIVSDFVFLDSKITADGDCSHEIKRGLLLGRKVMTNLDSIFKSRDITFSFLEPVCCSMSSSNCCFLTCIQISQEAGKVVWYSHLLKSFPQSIVIHTVKGFGIVNKAEIDVFLSI